MTTSSLTPKSSSSTPTSPSTTKPSTTTAPIPIGDDCFPIAHIARFTSNKRTRALMNSSSSSTSSSYYYYYPPVVPPPPPSSPLLQPIVRANPSILILLVILLINFSVNVNQVLLVHRHLPTTTSSTTSSSQSSSSNQQNNKNHNNNTNGSSGSSNVEVYRRPIPARMINNNKDSIILPNFVKGGDYIYYHNPDIWDGPPIVIESHKLIFFTIPKVGCTVWKQLFRRMMGYTNWKSQDITLMLPHNPTTNGLKYLYDYSLEDASIMMTSSEWTRAIMVRDPKLRLLSAFLDKVVSNDHQHIISRCCPDHSCVDSAQTIDGFLQLSSRCYDEHWRSQNDRIDYKYWPYIDVILHVENAFQDAKQLLQRINAWDQYGQSGWGEMGSESIFESREATSAGEHATWSQWKIWQWLTPELENKIENYYRGDYENPLFQFIPNQCLTCFTENQQPLVTVQSAAATTAEGAAVHPSTTTIPSPTSSSSSSIQTSSKET